MINEAWIKQVFDRIPKMVITLEDGDITVLGPVYLREKLVECRTYLNEVSGYLQSIKRSLWEVTRKLEASRAEYKIDLDQLIATDEVVRRGTSYKDRVASANQQLIDNLKEIADLEEQERDLKALEEVVKVKIRDLKDANADIRTAKQLMTTEISLEGYLGSEGGKEKKEKEDVNKDPSILLDGIPDDPPSIETDDDEEKSASEDISFLDDFDAESDNSSPDTGENSEEEGKKENDLKTIEVEEPETKEPEVKGEDQDLMDILKDL